MNPISEIQKYTGQFSGSGVNHEGQKFKGELKIEPIVGQKGAMISSLAIGDDGVGFHEEKSLLSPSMAEKINFTAY